MITYQYEEYKPVRQVWSWLAIILLTAVTAAWGMITHMAVPDVARHWDFDVLPDTPGISPYSTLPPPRGLAGAAADRSARGAYPNRATAGSHDLKSQISDFSSSAVEGWVRRIRAGAWLASATSGLYLIRLALWPVSGKPGATRRTGTVKIIVPLVLVLAIAGYVLYLMFSGPHMRVEPKILPYQALMPAMPRGTRPVAWTQTPNLESARNPVADTEATRRIGLAYYRDYCAFCHGQAGHGDGPVGRSYVPAPTDLTTPAIRDLSDGALYRAMLTGIGHTPVLDYVVDPNAPWYIIHYMRSFRD